MQEKDQKTPSWKERKRNAKNEKGKEEEMQKMKREKKKNSKTDRGKLPDRTQIEATFSSHNLED